MLRKALGASVRVCKALEALGMSGRYGRLYIQEPRSKKVNMEEFNLRKTRQHSTCYKPGRSNTLSEKVCMGFILSQTYSKLAVGPLAQTLCFLL